MWATLGLVARAMARAVRYPNDFAEARWLLDCRFGLIRRGLAGSVLSLASAAALAAANILARSPFMAGEVERCTDAARGSAYLPFLPGAALVIADSWPVRRR